MCRNTLLDKEKEQVKDLKITFNDTYYPVYRKLKSILKNLHAIQACNEEHQKLFPNVTITGFTNSKNLRELLVRAILSDIVEVGKSKLCKE